jgi:uncharacterized membrane protein
MKGFAVAGLQLTLALIVAGAGSAMILGADVTVRAFDNLNLGATPRMLIGAVEMLAGMCLLLPRSAMIGSAVLIALCASVSGAIIADAARDNQRVPLSGIAAPRVEPALGRDGIAAPHVLLSAASRDI